MSFQIRNFVIIAHVDHGKSTFADRLLEITATIPGRKMREQYLDQMELERERGITIKMAPVRMSYVMDGVEYLLHLIDTPGHSDFSYEVSRALVAVEGAVLLVDATQGIQAQTLANFRSAKKAGLEIVGAINKVDLFEEDDPRLLKSREGLAKLLECQEYEIFLVSGKTGKGVKELLEAIIRKTPPPQPPPIAINTKDSGKHSRGLIFDSFYDDHKGVVASVRVFDGSFDGRSTVYLLGTGTEAHIKEVGYFAPELKKLSTPLEAGMIGYIATGIRNPEAVRIGDTIAVMPQGRSEIPPPLHGYQEPNPVVFVSFYPEESDDFESLEKGLQKLKLNDSALSITPDQNELLGRGFKVGFLGRLHFEITADRLRQEFGVATVNTFPSVLYRIRTKGAWAEIVKPEDLPESYEEIWEPMVRISIFLPPPDLANIFHLYQRFRMVDIETRTAGDRAEVTARMPLAELISDFDDQLKSITAGFSSFSYELGEYEKTDIVRMDVLVSGNLVPGLSRFFPKGTYEKEGRKMIERLKKVLPRQQFAQPIQAIAQNKVIAREDIPALRKDVTGYLYGGDRTRKMKLWKKQQRGKKRLKERSEAKITPEVFRELLKK